MREIAGEIASMLDAGLSITLWSWTNVVLFRESLNDGDTLQC